MKFYQSKTRFLGTTEFGLTSLHTMDTVLKRVLFEKEFITYLNKDVTSNQSADLTHNTDRTCEKFPKRVCESLFTSKFYNIN